jgi:transketolase
MSESKSSSIEQLAVNTIRTLSMDGVQAANSGHPGTPMALAPVTFQLWTEKLRYAPQQPHWPNRDRFILSCGHASMLLYSMIHLSEIRATDHSGKLLPGPALKIEDLKNFRQLGSPCAGHPEYREASGIETTTGPLGAGCGNSVGMAIASKWLGATYNRPGHALFDYDVYVLCSDGDLMEGVACEAASLAGHLKLDNLCWIYDDNRITIEGHTDLAFSENVGRRFEGLGWHVVEVNDANDLAALSSAYSKFKQCSGKPTLIIVRSIIGYDSPNKADSHAAHGAPLGDEEIKLTKRNYGWPEDAKFLVPDEVKQYFRDSIGARGAKLQADWQSKFDDYCKQFPAEGKQLKALFAGELPEGWDSGLKPFAADEKGLATRVSSGKVLNMLAPNFPWLVGGSADLAPSTMTNLDKLGDFLATNYAGRNLHFGIREHAMGAICNGMSLGGLRSYGATFFVFTDYMRPAMRLSSIMHQPVLYVLTHDSIGLGEDGPTHQPVEHLAACRAIPGLNVFRPGDANEVLECYRTLLKNSDHPAALVLSRQNVATLDRTKYASAEGVARGGYVLSPAAGAEKGILIGTGSELGLCLQAQEMLAKEGIYCRVVSLPCFELFDAQDATYRESVLPSSLKLRVAVEAGIRQGWDKYIGLDGHFVGMSSFGASAPAGKLYEHFRITAAEIVRCVRAGS